jgi:hypothetical protein
MSDVVSSKIAGLGADENLSNDRAFNTRIEALNAASAAL